MAAFITNCPGVEDGDAAAEEGGVRVGHAVGLETREPFDLLAAHAAQRPLGVDVHRRAELDSGEGAGGVLQQTLFEFTEAFVANGEAAGLVVASEALEQVGAGAQPGDNVVGGDAAATGAAEAIVPLL